MQDTLLPARSTKRGGPTGRMTRHRQADWTGRFRTVVEFRFMPAHFDIRSSERVWTPVTGIVSLWRDWASEVPEYRNLAEVSATTLTAALKTLGYRYSPVRHRFTPDPRKVKSASTRGVIMPPARWAWGNWNPTSTEYKE